MTDSLDPESAAIVRAWAACDATVQEQAARDARQANDAESWTFRQAHVIAVWQDVLAPVDRLAAFALQEIRSKQRKLSAAQGDADDLFGDAVAEAKRWDAERQAERLKREGLDQ